MFIKYCRVKKGDLEKNVNNLSFLHKKTNYSLLNPSEIILCSCNVPQRLPRNIYPFYLEYFKTKFASNARIDRTVRDYNSLSDSSLIDFALSRSNFVKTLLLNIELILIARHIY